MNPGNVMVRLGILLALVLGSPEFQRRQTSRISSSPVIG